MNSYSYFMRRENEAPLNLMGQSSLALWSLEADIEAPSSQEPVVNFGHCRDGGDRCSAQSKASSISKINNLDFISAMNGSYLQEPIDVNRLSKWMILIAHYFLWCTSTGPGTDVTNSRQGDPHPFEWMFWGRWDDKLVENDYSELPAILSLKLQVPKHFDLTCAYDLFVILLHNAPKHQLHLLYSDLLCFF